MDGERSDGRFRSFLLGGLVGASAAIATARRPRPKRKPPRSTTAGLAAFEDAPCFHEVVERERAAERDL